ncbi:MAG: VOC family protein [Candidatus Babeliales bacterium]
MITQCSHLTILVHNQDEALTFYTNKLGFRLHTDAPFGPERWLTVCPEKNPDMEFVLALAQKDEDKALVGKQGGSYGIGILLTNDAFGDYKKFKDAGITMIGEPVKEIWGTGFGIKDLYGNTLYINEPA